jgi:hypothetical protein
VADAPKTASNVSINGNSTDPSSKAMLAVLTVIIAANTASMYLGPNQRSAMNGRPGSPTNNFVYRYAIVQEGKLA